MSQNINKTQEKIQKSNEERVTFFSTNPYWERRDKENKVKMEKIIKEENNKKMKEVKKYPYISEEEEIQMIKLKWQDYINQKDKK